MFLNDAQNQVLSKVTLFSGFGENEMAFIGSRVVPRKYAPSQIVFNEGDWCSGLYVVASGHVRYFQDVRKWSRGVLSIVGPGSSVAEPPVFDGGNDPASIAAVDDVVLLFVSKQDFQELCLTHPQVALKVLRLVGTRLRRLGGIIEELSFTTVRHRLAAVLLGLAKKKEDGSAITLWSRCPTVIKKLHLKSVRSVNSFPAT